jgi:hypothetical protein
MKPRTQPQIKKLDKDGPFPMLVATRDAKVFAKLPAAKSCRRIDFTRTEIRPGIVNGTYFLVVSGTKPYMNLQVILAPRVYVVRPKYWEIEVVGCLPGISLPALAPYSVTIPLDGIVGTKGIEVIGATKSKKHDILGTASPAASAGRRPHS